MTSEAQIRVARTIPNTSAEGPGNRYAVWVQGCTIRCLGCFNPHLWATTGGTPKTPGALLAEALDAGVEGVTLLGGEPFDQAPGLGELAAIAQDAGLTVMTFTGHRYESLRDSDDSHVLALLDATDLLVDGPYEADQPDILRPWVGSTNQRFHFLSNRYAHLQNDLTSLPDRLEVRVAPTGQVSVNGWASVDQLDALLKDTNDRLIKRGRIR